MHRVPKRVKGFYAKMKACAGPCLECALENSCAISSVEAGDHLWRGKLPRHFRVVNQVTKHSHGPAPSADQGIANLGDKVRVAEISELDMARDFFYFFVLGARFGRSGLAFKMRAMS